MSCFFACFRVKDSHNHNHVVVSPLDEPVVVSSNKNALSSLFLSDDDGLLGKAEKGRDSVELDFRELKNEAKFLKASGTIPETPVEIRKGSKKWEDISAKSEEGNASKFNLVKLSLESPTSVENCVASASAAGSLEETPSSCMTDGHSSRRVSISSVLTSDVKNAMTYADGRDTETGSVTSSVSAVVLASSVQGEKKSVRFDCKFDEYAFSSNDSSSEGVNRGLTLSPKPTPLKLSEEMQTPGTVFPAYTSNNDVGKPARISSQCIYPVQNHYEKSESGWKDLKAETSDSGCAVESPIINDATMFKSTKTTEDVSLTKQNGYNEQFGPLFGENLVYGRTPGDRPILGMVAAHWKDDESDHTSPVVWDGNGIPNSTNKYKEDQKVSWHATPFEERLEKALSEGTFASHRNHMSGTPPVEYNENEESDTALSHLQSPAHFKPVVSF